MKIPKEIRKAVEQRNKLNEEIRNWFEEQEIDLDGMDIIYAHICDKAYGKPQGDGEICDQTQIFEDTFQGTYYWECDNGQYLAMDFYI